MSRLKVILGLVSLIVVIKLYAASDFAPHDLTSNTSHSPFVSSASTEFSASFQAFNAFNGTSNYWLGSNAGVDWLRLDVGAGFKATLTSYEIQVNSVPEPLRAPKNWTMEGSNNGSSWTVLDTQTNQITWLLAQTRTFTLGSTSAAYRYFRINITANNGDADYTQIAELNLIGDLAAAPSGHNYGQIL